MHEYLPKNHAVVLLKKKKINKTCTYNTYNVHNRNAAMHQNQYNCATHNLE